MNPSTAVTEEAKAETPVADWHRIFESLREEHDYTADEVEGALPEGLRGTLYRNGPGWNEVGGKPFAHLFDGHGMIAAFTVADGRVHYRNRYVTTHKFLAERDAEKARYRSFGENLLPLREGGRPWALDPDTLETRGEYDFEGEPIFVPRRPDSGEDEGWLLSVAYSAAEHRSRLVVLDAADIESDPVAVAHLRHHVPLGFHGTYTDRVARASNGN